MGGREWEGERRQLEGESEGERKSGSVRERKGVRWEGEKGERISKRGKVGGRELKRGREW